MPVTVGEYLLAHEDCIVWLEEQVKLLSGEIKTLRSEIRRDPEPVVESAVQSMAQSTLDKPKARGKAHA